MFAPLSFCGENVGYAKFDSFINFRGDVSKMSAYSNVLPAIRRQIELFLTFAIFQKLGSLAQAKDMITLEFKESSASYRFYIMMIIGLR